jgi:DNA-binding MarR family transcriptional regulator
VYERRECKPRMSQPEKTHRAYRAYLNILDTADWLRAHLRGQIDCFGLTEPGFRLLEMIYQEGVMPMATAARRRGYSRQNLDVIVGRLEVLGLAARELRKVPPKPVATQRLSMAQRGRERNGRLVSLVGLTDRGLKLIEVLLPKHAMMVRSFMTCLDGREQDSVIRICEKLREGDIVKFITEMKHWRAVE